MPYIPPFLIENVTSQKTARQIAYERSLLGLPFLFYIKEFIEQDMAGAIRDIRLEYVRENAQIEYVKRNPQYYNILCSTLLDDSSIYNQENAADIERAVFRMQAFCTGFFAKEEALTVCARKFVTADTETALRDAIDHDLQMINPSYCSRLCDLLTQDILSHWSNFNLSPQKRCSLLKRHAPLSDQMLYLELKFHHAYCSALIDNSKAVFVCIVSAEFINRRHLQNFILQHSARYEIPVLLRAELDRRHYSINPTPVVGECPIRLSLTSSDTIPSEALPSTSTPPPRVNDFRKFYNIGGSLFFVHNPYSPKRNGIESGSNSNYTLPQTDDHLPGFTRPK
ncbi:MAG: hypothetical protein Q8R79_00270 [Legionellaceae bacterium]|nr:hypothetical protein [Legionellaceae bacterium]